MAKVSMPPGAHPVLTRLHHALEVAIAQQQAAFVFLDGDAFQTQHFFSPHFLSLTTNLWCEGPQQQQARTPGATPLGSGSRLRGFTGLGTLSLGVAEPSLWRLLLAGV
jgi:hypothetical protein